MATPSSGISPILPASTGSGALDAYTSASLGALSGGVDYTQSPTYKSLLSMLGPGPNGGLNPNLAAQYSSGSQIIGQNTQGNVAQAMSGAEGRGLGGSSIAAQGVENAQFQGTMANSSLLASLYGQQNQNTSQLAQDLVSGSNSEMTSLLGIYESAGTSAANMKMYSDGLREALAAAHDAASASQNAGMFAGLGALGGGLLAASDARLKQNIECAGTVGPLGVYRFEYKPGLGLPAGQFVGFLAHEVLKTHPEAVVELDNGFLAVKAPFLPRKVS